ncbi:MAG: heat-shock protein HtpX, partial [Anaerolineae bacterium]|nr:heat-shock protein HtpX [Anaerolineae bacterium]
MKPTILFLCPHGAAKSVLAAAYFQRLAEQHSLNLHVTFAGTEPDAAVAPAVAALLQSQGVDLSEFTPRLVTKPELESAHRVISMGCDVRALAPGVQVDDWSDVPPVS